MGGTNITEGTLVFLLTATLCSGATLMFYLHVTEPMTWAEARRQCRAASSDLLTFHTLDIIDKIDLTKKHVWIGLQRDQEQDSVWRWINVETGFGTEGEEVSSSSNWSEDTESMESEQTTDLDCGSLDPVSGDFVSVACTAHKPALCSKDNLLLVNERKTWEEAVRHCRDVKVVCDRLRRACRHHYELVSLPYPSQSGYAKVKIVNATTDEVWVGLRFLEGGWWWLDGAEVDVEHHNLLPGCPLQQQRCGTLSKDKATTALLIRDCSERKSFICARVN